jgi:hypothetical protein
MSTRRGRGKLEQFPLREELETHIHVYHHLQNEHHRAALESSTRRRIESELLDLRERFDRLLDEWIADEELRNRWRAYIDTKQPEPDEPTAIEPLVFEGTSSVSGSVVELRGRPDDLRVEVDGTLVERVVAGKDFAGRTPPARFHLDNDTVFEETFSVPDEALAALEAFLEEGGSPPWEHSAALLSDGIIDVHFDLTPRGHRALALRA